jgi:hypothetical protein
VSRQQRDKIAKEKMESFCKRDNIYYIYQRDSMCLCVSVYIAISWYFSSCQAKLIKMYIVNRMKLNLVELKNKKSETKTKFQKMHTRINWLVSKVYKWLANQNEKKLETLFFEHNNNHNNNIKFNQQLSITWCICRPGKINAKTVKSTTWYVYI